jgi:hypothetical protein
MQHAWELWQRHTEIHYETFVTLNTDVDNIKKRSENINAGSCGLHRFSSRE